MLSTARPKPVNAYGGNPPYLRLKTDPKWRHLESVNRVDLNVTEALHFCIRGSGGGTIVQP